MSFSYYWPGQSGSGHAAQLESTKPPFNMALQKGTLVGKPPFEFQKVVLRHFPLKANFRALARFCDKYVNIAPRKFAYFRPAMPFVILTVVNYGKMSAVAGNLGWTSQNELLFAIPLEWYRREGRRWAFKGLAQVSPFIFVDDEDSQVTGREVYGWPKVQGWYSPGVNPWARHPLNRRQLLSLEANVFAKMFANEVPGPREILSIEEEAPPSFSVVPPQTDNILNPWVSIPKAIAGWGGILQTVAEMFTSPAFFEGQPELLGSMAENLGQFTRLLHANTVNLKQMRDAADPQEICYQALTNAQMEISQIRRGGMLGDLALLRGDPTGGFQIQLHEYASQPIAETLGLEVARRVDGSVPVVTLNPVMPFWQELDLTYLAGENICWRTKTRDWGNDEAPGAEREAAKDQENPAKLLYNTMGSNGFEVATGPFLSDASVRVLPLPADKAKLQKLVDEYLNGNDAPYQFEVWGNYVYMLVIANEDMASKTADIGNWAKTQVDFAIPLRWFEGGVRGNAKSGDKPDEADPEKDFDWVEVAEGRSLVSCGYFSPFTFTDSAIGNRTAREVYGWEARKAEIVRPESTWLDRNGPFTETKPLMEINVDVLPALNLDQKTDLRTLVQVVAGDVHDDPKSGRCDERTWEHIADTWGRRRKRELERMEVFGSEKRESRSDAPIPHFSILRALSIDLLFNRKPFNQISLKQFRDAKNVDRACYQGYVRSETVIDRLSEIKEIEEKIHVVIHRYPTMPIAELLGLDVKLRMFTDHGEADVLQPSRAFYMKGQLNTGVAENFLWRTGNQWESDDRGRKQLVEHWCKALATKVRAEKAAKAKGEDGETERDADAQVVDAIKQIKAARERFVNETGREPRYFEGPRDDKTAVGASMVKEIDGKDVADRDPSSTDRKEKLLSENIPSTLHSRDWPDDSLLSYRDAIRGVLDPDLEPQMVVHATLSNRWQDPNPPEALGKTKRPNFLIRRDSLGSSPYAKQVQSLFELSEETWDKDYADIYWSPWSAFAPPLEMQRDQPLWAKVLEIYKDEQRAFEEQLKELRKRWPSLRSLDPAKVLKDMTDPFVDAARAQRELYEFEFGELRWYFDQNEWFKGKWTAERVQRHEESIGRLSKIVIAKRDEFFKDNKWQEQLLLNPSRIDEFMKRLDQATKEYLRSLEDLRKWQEDVAKFCKDHASLKYTFQNQNTIEPGSAAGQTLQELKDRLAKYLELNKAPPDTSTST